MGFGVRLQAMSLFQRFFHRPAEPIGRRGERLAAKWLRRRNYRILARNLPLVDDEAALVALDLDCRTIVIVEVKTRAAQVPAPEARIARTKQCRLALLAPPLKQA